MKTKKLVKNNYFLLLMLIVISSLILVIFFVPVSYEDPFVSITGQFGINLNPDNFAPASVLQELRIGGFSSSTSTTSSSTTSKVIFSSLPNTFSSCNFGDRINIVDGAGKKTFLDGNQIDIIPITSPNALITTSTNRNIDHFLTDTHGTCTI